MRRLVRSFPPLLAFAVVLALPVLAQDSTVVVDRTGIFGPIIDNFWPVVVTFLASLTVKVATFVSDKLNRAGEPVKWAALYFAALGWNLLSGWLALGADLDPGAPVFAVSFAEMAAAGLVYKFAGHKPVSRVP